MDWKDEIPGCFGIVDQIFAGHPMDENRAFDLLARLRMEQRPFEHVIEAFESYLKSKGCGQNHIREQMQRVRAHYAPWIE